MIGLLTSYQGGGGIAIIYAPFRGHGKGSFGSHREQWVACNKDGHRGVQDATLA